MTKFKNIIVLVVSLSFCFTSGAQTDSINQNNDSIQATVLQDFNNKLAQIEQQRVADSIQKADLEFQLDQLKSTENLEKEELLNQLKIIDQQEKQRIAEKKARIELLRKTAQGYPITGVLGDTLFLLNSRIGASTPLERAARTTARIAKLYDTEFLKIDSILVSKSDYTYDIIYGETVIMSISENDAIWYNDSMSDLADECRDKIVESIKLAKKENSLGKLLLRIGLVILVLGIARLIIWLVGKGYVSLLKFIDIKKKDWLKNLKYNKYTFMTKKQELQVILFLAKALRGFVYVVLLYTLLPVLFSIFPFSRDWADALFQLVWSPMKGVVVGVWNYLPNLFSIMVIYFSMKYVIRFVRYIFSEIQGEKLVLSGFHADWAMPTFSIVKFLLYAFMFVLIFPMLPGSDSNIFKGVSVFIGVLFSLGSSSAIANMVAGLVITYMRPFKIGDRIKIGDASGDVIEKTLLVTRIKTIKNEIITIPNSSVLSGNTTNYTSEASEQGLVVHSTITLGYDVPWKNVHEVLINAALKTDFIIKNPKPFVLQTSLEDFYVAYQINAYTKEASKQALIYSSLHQNIQDCCNEAGIEILSPHYRGARDGNMTTIPADYLPKDYKSPGFNIKIDKSSDK